VPLPQVSNKALVYLLRFLTATVALGHGSPLVTKESECRGF
jgi:hypothetical protein